VTHTSDLHQESQAPAKLKMSLKTLIMLGHLESSCVNVVLSGQEMQRDLLCPEELSNF
jgi:hypothetical protein